MNKRKFLNFLEFEKRYSAHTIAAYKLEIDRFLDFLKTEDIAFEEVDYRIVRHFLATLKENGRQASSINRSISSLRSFYKFLVREGVVASSPMQLVHALKTPRKLPVVVEQEKMVSLLDAGITDPDSFEEARDFVILELLFGTGIRLSELLAIQERDIDTYNKRILIHGKRGKERLVPVHQTLLEEIRRYLMLKYAQDFKNKSTYLIVTKEGKQAYTTLIYRMV